MSHKPRHSVHIGFFCLKRSTRQVATMLLLALPRPPVRSNDTNRDRLSDFHEMRHSEGFNENNKLHLLQTHQLYLIL